MGKVKIKRKDTRIDMTAMSDVTVLLLTFFMLTSTFLQKEPVTVITPPSVSEEKVPDEKLMSVLVGQDGKVFIALTGTKDSTLKSEKFRADVLKNAVGYYNQMYKTPINLTQKELDAFSKIGTFGVPLGALKKWLDLPTDERDAALKTAGIPITRNEDPDKPNEFQIWIKSVYAAMEENGIGSDMDSGTGIAIKADQSTPYERVEIVMDNLQTMKHNKFSLMTALKKEED